MEGVLNELPYDDDLVLMSKTMDGLRNKLSKCKKAFECNGFKVTL